MSEVLKRRMRCAVYTRKSTDEGLDQEYNSIDAQRDAVDVLHDDVGHKPPFHLLAEFGKWLVDMSQETRDDKEDRRSIEQKELLEPGVGLSQINQVYHDDVQDEHTLQKV